MRPAKWHPDELRVCKLAYARAGSAAASEVLRILGWQRSISAIRCKMRKLIVPGARIPKLTPMGD